MNNPQSDQSLTPNANATTNSVLSVNEIISKLKNKKKREYNKDNIAVSMIKKNQKRIEELTGLPRIIFSERQVVRLNQEDEHKKGLCQFPNCTKKLHSRGVCVSHYHKARRMKMKDQK